MEKGIFLYRGFVVNNLKEIARKGFNIRNRDSVLGEINWPGGISFGRNDMFEFAQEVSRQKGGIPVCGRIKISEDNLKDINLTGIKRILDFSEGMTPGGIDHWRCLDWNDLQKAWEFTLSPNDLKPDKILKLYGAFSIEPGIYKPFSEFKSGVEGKGFFERFLRR
jgi:hypothetical protein